jgi:SAM-dependent methyltransferase
MSNKSINCALPASGRFENLKPARGYFGSFNHVGEGFHVGGWMSAPSPVEFSAFALYLNQELVGVAEPGKAPKNFGTVRHQGEPQLFEFHLSKMMREIPNFTRVEVLGCVGDQPERRLTTLFRRDMETAVPTPPQRLMYRVTGNTDGNLVKVAGLRCTSNFLDAIYRYRDLSSVRSLLDWGCGCGRVTVHLIDLLSKYEGLQVEGCDIDGEAIDWCKENLPRGRFRHIGPFPPLPWSDASFDVVVSCSVFTHLSEEVQQLWLGEMRRIISPGGLFLASVKSFPDSSVPKRGISDDTLDVMLDGIAPTGYYRGTVQSREYTIGRWSHHFDILDFIEDGLEGSQDLVVMRRP